MILPIIDSEDIMINYYKELGLNPSSSLEEINQELTKQEGLWTRRQVNNPEKATQKLSMIMQARKVFSNQSSKMEYDRSLNKSKEQPPKNNPQAERQKQFRKWSNQAKSYLETNQYDLAKSAIEKALSLYDTNTDDYHFLALVAEVYLRNNNFQLALDYINKAIILNTDFPSFYIIKAAIQREMSNQSLRYNNLEWEKQLQSARDSLNHAVRIAQRNNDKHMESAAFGLLAYYYYFVPSPNRARAEEYAKKSIALGDVNGNASKVMEDLNQKREQERKAAEAERQRQEAERRRQREIQIRNEQAEREWQKRQEEAKKKDERKLRKQKFAKIFRRVSTVIAFLLYLYVWYLNFAPLNKITGTNHNSRVIDINAITIFLSIAVALFIFGQSAIPGDENLAVVPVIVVSAFHTVALFIYNKYYINPVKIYPQLIELVIVVIAAFVFGRIFWKAYHKER